MRERVPQAPGERPTLLQYWHTGRPPDETADLLASFDRLNPGSRRRLFDAAEAESLIASRFSAREVTAFGACAVPAMQADYFRYCAVAALGGTYADVDLRWVAPLRPLLDAAPGGGLLGRPNVPRGWPRDLFGHSPRVGPYRIVANSFLSFPAPGHPLPRLALEVATANVERRVAEDVSIVTGPGILTSIYLLDRLGSTDAFLDYAEGGILAPTAALLCEVVGEPERATAALDGVTIAPFGGDASPVRESEAPLAYKSTDVHWPNVTTSIFT